MLFAAVAQIAAYFVMGAQARITEKQPMRRFSGVKQIPFSRHATPDHSARCVRFCGRVKPLMALIQRGFPRRRRQKIAVITGWQRFVEGRKQCVPQRLGKVKSSSMVSARPFTANRQPFRNQQQKSALQPQSKSRTASRRRALPRRASESIYMAEMVRGRPEY